MAEQRRMQQEAAARQQSQRAQQPVQQPTQALPAQNTGASGNGSSSPRGSGTKQAGITWDDYQRYENDYATWQQTGQHTADYNTWATEASLNQWKAIRDRAKSGAQAALIGDRYYTLDKGLYNQYEKDYRYWQKTGQHTKGYETWATEDGLDTWKTIREYNDGVRSGKNPSMELQSWINGLDPEALEAVRKEYQSGWTYDVTDPEDMARQAQGLMPKNKEKYYSGKSELDRWLYAQGLPSNKSDYLSKKYAAALANLDAMRAQQTEYDFDSTPERQAAGQKLADYFRSTWKYGTGAEDKQRQAQGLMPASVEKLYTGTALDQYYMERGLPPASQIKNYVEQYDAKAGAFAEFEKEYDRRRRESPWMTGQQVLEQIIREDRDGTYRSVLENLEGTTEEKQLDQLTGKDLLSAYLGTGSSKSGERSPFAFTAAELDDRYQTRFAEAWKTATGKEYRAGDYIMDYVIGSSGDSLADKTYNFRKGAEELDYSGIRTRLDMITMIEQEMEPQQYGDWTEKNAKQLKGKTDAQKKTAYSEYKRQWSKDHPAERLEKLKESLGEQKKYLHKLLKKAAKPEYEDMTAEEQARRQPTYDVLQEAMGLTDEQMKTMLEGKPLSVKEARALAGKGSVYSDVFYKLQAEKNAAVEADKADPEKREAEVSAKVREFMAADGVQADPKTLTWKEWYAREGSQYADIDEAMRAFAAYKDKNDDAIREYRKKAEAETPATDADYAKIAMDAWSTIMNPTEYETHGGDSVNGSEYMTLLPFLQPDQLKEFIRLAKEDGAVAAGRYWTEIRPDAEKLQREKNTAAAQLYAESSPWGATAVSALLTIPAGVQGIRQVVGAVNGDYRENDWRGDLGRVQETLRGTVQNEIRERNGKTLAFMYGEGMSMADSLQSMALGNIGLALTSFRAAGSTVDEFIDKGMTAQEAGTIGIISGTIEFLTEKMQMDRLVGMLTSGAGKSFLVGILREGLSEGGEEVVSEAVNIIGDYFLFGDRSEIMQQIEAYKRNGMSDGDALWTTIWKDCGGQILSAFAGGFVSGVLFGIGGDTIASSDAAKKSGLKWYNFKKGRDILIAYEDAKARAGTAIPEGKIRGLYRDLGNSGLSEESALGAAIVLQNAAQMPNLYMSESGKQRIENLQTAIRKAAEQNRVATAEANEARTKAQNRLNDLLGGIRSAYDQAGAALASGNLIAQTTFLNQMYDAIERYNGAYAEAQAQLETQAAKQASAAADAGRVVDAAAQQARGALDEAGREMSKDLLTKAAVVVDSKGNAVQVDDDTLAAIRRGDMDIESAILWAGEDAAPNVQPGQTVRVVDENGNEATVDADTLNSIRRGDMDVESAGLFSEAEREGTEAERTGETQERTEAEEDGKSGEDEGTDTVEEIDRNAETEAKSYGRGISTEGVDLKKQTRSIRRQARVLDTLGKRAGVSFVLHDTLEDRDGTPINAYIDKGNVIHVNMQQIGDGLLYYSTHEIVHDIRRNGEEGEAFYQKMRDMIRENAGISEEGWNDRLENTMRVYGYEDTEENRARAEEELVCDRMPAAFGNAQFTADLVNRDAGFARRVLNAINRVYQNVMNSVLEAGKAEDAYTASDIRMLMRNADVVREMADTLQNALTMMEKKGAHTEAARYVSGTDGDVQFNLATMERDLQAYIHDIAQAKIPGFGRAELRELEKGVEQIMDIVREHADLYDFDSPLGKKRPWTPIKDNSDKHYKMALDFSTLCKKRILTQQIIERLQTDLKRSLTPGEQMAIRYRLQDMQKELTHIQIACGLCYVEAARLRSPKVINAFIADIPKSVARFYAKNNQAAKDEIAQRHAELLERYAKDGVVPKSKKELPAAGKAEWERINNEVWDRTTPPEDVMERARQMKPEQFLTAKSLADMAVTDPDIYQAFKLQVTSAARSKTLETDIAFERGDTYRASDALIEEMNRESGFRHQSWSDFQFLHVLDTMAAIMEMSTRGAKMHAYSKVGAMAHVVGKTGLMLNLSMIPAGETGLDENGNLAADPVEGMDRDEMMRLRDMYPDTVGNIWIGITDDQIYALMASDDVDYIIPYHASGLNKSMRKMMGLHGWISYQAAQNEKRFRDTQEDPPALADWFDEKAAKRAKDGRAFMTEASRKYLQECYDRGYVPKFSQYLKKDGNRYSLPEDGSADGYWKMLIDRKMVNQQTGRVIIQQPVRPVFDTNKIGALMRADVYNPVHRQEAQALDEAVSEIRRGELNISDKAKRDIALKEMQPVLAQYRMAQKGVNTGDLTEAVIGEQYSKKKQPAADQITQEDVDQLHTIGKKNINNFSSSDLQKSEKWAKRFFKELGAKSPFFRAWFGEWRAHDTGDVYVADKAEAKRGTTHNDDTGWDIQISGKVFNETNRHESTINEEARPYLPFINDIVKKAILLNTTGSSKTDGQSLFMHEMYAIADIGKGPELLKLYVEEKNNPKNGDSIRRTYSLHNIEIQQPQEWSSQSSKSTFTSRIRTAVIKNISQLFESVKQHDRLFHPGKAVDPQLLNEDGTPKTFYYGTTNGETVLTTTDIGHHVGTAEQASRQTGNRNGTRIMWVYATAQKLLDVGTDYGSWDGGNVAKRMLRDGLFKGNAEAEQRLKEITKIYDGKGGKTAAQRRNSEMRKFLQENGYDGITYRSASGQELILLDSEQVKSADENRGTFDRRNRDIYYSLKKPTGDLTEAVTDREKAREALDANLPEGVVKGARNLERGQQGAARSGDLTEAAVPTFDVQKGKPMTQTGGTGDLTAAVTETTPEEARKRAEAERKRMADEKKKRDRARREERQKAKIEAAKRAAEEKMLAEGTFAPQYGRDSQDARTKRKRLTAQAAGTSRQLSDLVNALNEEFKPSDRKTPNPKAVAREVNRILKGRPGVTMQAEEIGRRLAGITEEFRNNPDGSRALENMLTGCDLLARDIIGSERYTAEEFSPDAYGEGENGGLMRMLSETQIKVGPTAWKQLMRAFGSYQEYQKAVGGRSVLNIRRVDSDSKSTYEDLGGMINGYLDEGIRAEIDRAFGGTNTIDIVELAEWVAEQRAHAEEKMDYRGLVGEEQYESEALELAYELAQKVYDPKNGIPNRATYADRGAKAVADVGRDLNEIARLVNEQQQRIADIEAAGNEEADAANHALFRANQAYREAYRAGKTEREALAERNRILNEEHERIANTYEATMNKRAREGELVKALVGRERRLNTENERLVRRLEATGNALATGKQEANAALRRENTALRNQLDRKEERFEAFRQKAKEREQAHVEKVEKEAEEKEKVTKLRRYVTKNATALNTWLQNPTKQKHVPLPLQEAVAGILENIDIAIGKNGGNAKARDFAKSVAGLREFYSDYLTGAQTRYGEFFRQISATVPEGTIDALDTIAAAVNSGKSIGQMNSEELASLNLLLGHTRSMIVDANTMMKNERFKSVDELGRQTQKDAAARKEWNVPKQLRGVYDLLNTKMMDAFSWAKSLGAGAESIVDELEKGFERSYSLIRKGTEWTGDMLKQNGVSKKELRQWSRDAIEVKLDNSGTVRMTAAQAMEIYALSKRAQAVTHMLEGGIEIADMAARGKRQIEIKNLTEQDLRRIGDRLNAKQKAAADAMQEYLSTEAAAWGNEAWVEMYHYEMFNEANYWPIRSAGRSVKTKDPISGSSAFNALVNMGSTKALMQHAKNPVQISDAFDTFSGHVAQMARLNGLGAAVEDALKWFNWVQQDAETGEKEWNATTKGNIDRVMGPAGQRFFLQLIQDINGLSGGESGTQLASQLMSRYKRAAVAGKLRVVIQQPTAVIRSFALISPKYFANEYAGNIRKNIREMQEKNGLAWWKSQGNYDIGTGKSMRSIFFGTDNAVDDITNAAMEPAGWADDFAWGWLWSAVKNETEDLHPELAKGSDAYWDEVNRRFSQIVNETQVVDGVLQRSDIMRSKNGLDQMATAFMSEPTKSYNMIMNRVRAIRAGGGKEAWKELIRAMIAFAMSVTVNSAVLAAHDSAKNRQRGDRFSTAFTDNFYRNVKGDLLHPWEYVPYIKDIAAIMEGDTVERMDMSMVSDVVKAVEEGWKYFNGTGTKTGYKVASDILSVAGAAAGVPATGLIATMETVANGIHPGAIKKTKYLDSDDRALLRAAGISYDEGYGVVSQYKRHPFAEGSASSNADKGIRLLQAADVIGGSYDSDDYGALAAILNIDYDPAKDGTLQEWTAEQSAKYLESKRKALKKGSITQEAYDAIEERYAGYADLLGRLGY